MQSKFRCNRLKFQIWMTHQFHEQRLPDYRFRTHQEKYDYKVSLKFLLLNSKMKEIDLW
jgi:hypothetical protein